MSLFCYHTSRHVTFRRNKLSIFKLCKLLTSVPVWPQNNSSTARTVFRLTENPGAIQTSRLCNDEQHLWEQHERPTSSYLLWVEPEFSGHFTEEATNSCNQKGGWVGQPVGPGVMFRVNTSESGLRHVTSNVNSQGTCTPPPPPQPLSLPFHHPLLIADRKSIARIQMGES